MAKYIKAKSGPGKSVIYTDDSGKQWQSTRGSRPWRNQNPGNLVVGKVSKRNDAIGKAGGFAIFPDYSTGHAALLDSLKNEHGNQDIPSFNGRLCAYTYSNDEGEEDSNNATYDPFVRIIRFVRHTIFQFLTF